MRLGGQTALHALHKAAGFPGASTVYAKIRERSMKFVVCASLEKDCLVAAITANLERFSRLYDGERRVVILEIDEIATEPRARYYGLTDEILGLCVQHTPPKSTKFDLDNLEDLSGRLNEGHSHIGSEHTVISACALGDTPHHAIPVVAFASCKARNPGQQQLVFETVRHCIIVSLVEVPGKLCLQLIWLMITRKVEASRGILEVWNDRFAPTIDPIVLVASDGDGVRRRLLYNFTSSVTSEKFAEFDLLDAMTSEYGVVQCFDLKHNLKRLRTRDISKRGVKISASALPLNCDSFPQLFRWYDCKPNETYRTLLNPDDRTSGLR
ncbi:conserved unknown protein [Ectocarpus siliculosus]|uniref:Uncharacterized protein n=1 Tax=Ectocarpus siliculosus TaxID=2880 RepID=D7G6P9_ECTSI|nr:conserved unknown protein [Ectocarpus siliculosus]|eukprot:CBJ27634.1 conserved unknown protein [Ectocarpus siliculosus]